MQAPGLQTGQLKNERFSVHVPHQKGLPHAPTADQRDHLGIGRSQGFL